MFALIINSEATTAAATSGDALEQGGTFTDRTGGLMRKRMGVFCYSALVHLIRFPVDKALMVVADQDGPFGTRQAAYSSS